MCECTATGNLGPCLREWLKFPIAVHAALLNGAFYTILAYLEHENQKKTKTSVKILRLYQF